MNIFEFVLILVSLWVGCAVGYWVSGTHGTIGWFSTIGWFIGVPAGYFACMLLYYFLDKRFFHREDYHPQQNRQIAIKTNSYRTCGERS